MNSHGRFFALWKNRPVFYRVICSSGFSLPVSFSQNEKFIHGGTGKSFLGAVRPEHGDRFNGSVGAKAEVQGRIVAGEITGGWLKEGPAFFGGDERHNFRANG